MTALLAKSLGPEIRVNAIAPGLVKTPRTQDWHEIHRSVSETVALRRVGSVNDIAKACMLLALADYVTGAVLTVDGGFSLL
jgi:ketoreductase RED2